MAARAKNKTIPAEQFAHAISGHYRDFEHANTYTECDRTSARAML